MIAPQEFKKRWERLGDRLIMFPEISLCDVLLPATARTFLREAGLPEDAAPGLNFGTPQSGSLPRASILWRLPTAFDRYRIIGGNGSGDSVCLDEDANAQVVYLNHDNDFDRVLMASSVCTLAECLAELRDVIARTSDTGLVAPEHYDQLLERLRIIDPAACDNDGFWPAEISSLKPQPPKKWWHL
ncbi:MAG TPA: SUKH-4 family immunity protein [Candidatus Sulfotelmatobacter sp.]|nr:SUKH-4 family immunity protein [Candidatus Sulfotelmatobacter sp.]